jgi:hypothetical protein
MRLPPRFAGGLLLLSLLSCWPASADERIVVDRERAIRLFGYPTNDQVTLKQTILLWLSESLRRDGFTNTNVSVNDRGNDIEISFVGSGASIYAARLPKFLNIGEKAYSGVVKLKEAGQWHDSEWRFLLPLGLPMVNYKSVQLLHFPPIAVLTCFQDYLKVPTTKRWADLLVLNEALADTDLYQAIADIAPIAAPESAGEDLKEKNIPGLYTVMFKEYIDSLLEFWADSRNHPPMVAFGEPARDYVKVRYLDSGVDFRVLDYQEIKLSDGTQIPVLGANHPSKFYFAIAKKLQGAVKFGASVTRQDLIAACWQVKMADGNADGKATLTKCEDSWNHRDQEICQTVVKHAREPNPPFPALFEGHGEEAAAVCNSPDFPSYKLISEKSISDFLSQSGVPIE